MARKSSQNVLAPAALAPAGELARTIPFTIPPPPAPLTRGSLDDDELRRLALHIRRDTMHLTWHSGTGSSHVGGELSLAEIIAVLYGNYLRLDPSEPRNALRDRLILSKGHASAVMYVAMAWRGFFPRDRLFDQFNRVGGFLQEHVNMETPGAEIPTGSLGMGLSAGAGIAWGCRHLYGEDRPFSTFVVMSDGECHEGQTWEAAMASAQYQLDGLVAIIDYNHMVVTGRIENSINPEPFAAKWQAFGWATSEVDGHDVAALRSSLDQALSREYEPGKPRVIIAHTLKGNGVSFAQGNNSWHAGHLNEQQYRQALAELA